MCDSSVLRWLDVLVTLNQSTMKYISFASATARDIACAICSVVRRCPCFWSSATSRCNGKMPRESRENRHGMQVMEAKMKNATAWDTSEYLTAEEGMTVCLNAALGDGGISAITAALGDIARATWRSKEADTTHDGI